MQFCMHDNLIMETADFPSFPEILISLISWNFLEEGWNSMAKKMKLYIYQKQEVIMKQEKRVTTKNYQKLHYFANLLKWYFLVPNLPNHIELS